MSFIVGDIVQSNHWSAIWTGKVLDVFVTEFGERLRIQILDCSDINALRDTSDITCSEKSKYTCLSKFWELSGSFSPNKTLLERKISQMWSRQTFVKGKNHAQS